jgi:hypothetical protein
MGRAEELFARIRDKGAPEIREMVARAEVEELFLDYKGTSTTLPSLKLKDDDRRNVAKAISGFGNSEGGVIVWGVDCRRTAQGDVPSAAIPITDARAFKTLLDGAVGGLTLPAHTGVENLELPDGQGATGFVVTHIPSGTSAPYRAMPQQEYYIRAGPTFLPTPHGVLAGLFGRAPQPMVVPVLRYRNTRPVQQNQIRIFVEVHIRNDGRGFAEDIFAVVNMHASKRCEFEFPSVDPLHERWRTVNEVRNSYTTRLRGLSLPPGTEKNGFVIVIGIPPADVGDISVEVTCGSQGRTSGGSPNRDTRR